MEKTNEQPPSNTKRHHVFLDRFTIDKELISYLFENNFKPAFNGVMLIILSLISLIFSLWIVMTIVRTIAVLTA